VNNFMKDIGRINYEGKIVAYIERPEYDYAQLAVVDGEFTTITDSGLLLINESVWIGEECAEFTPSHWVFVDGAPETGLHNVNIDYLPELLENVDGIIGGDDE
jgi:hypothetical protein